jgi:hypothetical protein
MNWYQSNDAEAPDVLEETAVLEEVGMEVTTTMVADSKGRNDGHQYTTRDPPNSRPRMH